MSEIYQSPLRDLAEQVLKLAREHPAYSQCYATFQQLDEHLLMQARLEEINREGLRL